MGQSFSRVEFVDSCPRFNGTIWVPPPVMDEPPEGVWQKGIQGTCNTWMLYPDKPEARSWYKRKHLKHVKKFKHILNLVCLQLQCFVPGISGHQHLKFHCQPPHVLGECSCGSLTNFACYRGGRGEWSYWISLDVIGFPWFSRCQCVKSALQTFFLCMRNGGTVLYWFQSVSAILYLISGELPLWHWGPLYTGSVPRLNSYSSTNMHSYTDNIQLFCLVEPVPKLELDRLCTIETAILWWYASCSFQQRF